MRVFERARKREKLDAFESRRREGESDRKGKVSFFSDSVDFVLEVEGFIPVNLRFGT